MTASGQVNLSKKPFAHTACVKNEPYHRADLRTPTIHPRKLHVCILSILRRFPFPRCYSIESLTYTYPTNLASQAPTSCRLTSLPARDPSPKSPCFVFQLSPGFVIQPNPHVSGQSRKPVSLDGLPVPHFQRSWQVDLRAESEPIFL